MEDSAWLRSGTRAGRFLLFSLFALAVGSGFAYFVHASSERALSRSYPVDPARLGLRVSAKATDLERGRHLATVVAQCPFCHGTDLGGREMADDSWIGRLDAPNLTPGLGGLGRIYRRADWVRAIRYGVARDGRSLLLMPAGHLSQMSDGDLAALIVYLEKIPAVDRPSRPFRVGWLTRAALAAGAASDLLSAPAVDRERVGPTVVEPRPSVDYGRYLVDLGSCRTCHHADLRGGLHPLSLPGEPPPSDLRPGGAMVGWTRADFERAMRFGRTPDGRSLDREFMPWPTFAGLETLELDAIWLYLRSLDRRDDTRSAMNPSGSSGAAKKTRTSTGLPPPAPQAGASTNSATAAHGHLPARSPTLIGQQANVGRGF